jgi:FAD/FMN-containing dehydrogenase
VARRRSPLDPPPAPLSPPPEGLDRRDLLALGAGAVLAAGFASHDLAGAATSVRPDPALRELERALVGELVVPGRPAYETARRPYNDRYTARPRAIAFPAGPGDVARAIRWARRHGVRIAVRSGGHSYAAYSSSAGLVLDLGRLRTVRVDRARRLATVGAGARLIDVYAALWEHGLTVPAGSCPTVGIAGLALGGGVGFSSRRFGLTCDNLRSVTIVTADGRVRTCDADTAADLFWACRGGGGGNFGVATRFVFRAHPVGRVSTYRITWPWSQAARALTAWQAWAPDAPDALFSVLQLAAPGVGARLSVGSSGQFHGSEAELRRLVEPLVASGAVSLSVRSMSYWDATLSWAGCDELSECRRRGHAVFAAKSHYAKRSFSRAAIERLVGWVERRQTAGVPGRGSVLLDSYGGAIGRVPRAATAFAHRDARFQLQYLTYWDRAGEGRAALGWLRGVHSAMRPHTSGAYVNYVDPELRDWQRAYYGANLGRLRQVKRRYDPQNVFRFRQSIRPA